MEKVVRAFVFLWVLICGGLCVTYPASAVELKYIFVNGAQTDYENVSDSTELTTQEGLEIAIKSTQNLKIGFSEKVLELINPNTARIEQKILSMIGTATVRGQQYTYNSTTGAPTNTYFLPLSTLVGKSIPRVMTNKGNIQQISGLQDLQSSMAGSIVSLKMSTSYNDDTVMNQALAALSVSLPPGDLSTGATWQNTMILPHPLYGAISLTVSNTFAAIESVSGYSCAKINFTFNGSTGFTPANTALVVDGSPITSQNKIEISGSGSAWLATDEGIIVKATSTTNMSLNSVNSIFAKDQTYRSSSYSKGTTTSTLTLLQYLKP